MKIYLFLSTKILTFGLPKDIDGSFSFDEDMNKESKLINVEAGDNAWYLCSTGDAKVLNNSVIVEKVKLETDKFYNISYENNKYLIYVTNNQQNRVDIYKYTDESNIIIGNTANCNINYKFGLNEEIEIQIVKTDMGLQLEYIKGTIYVNEERCVQNRYLKMGDKITIYELNITFLNNIILIKYLLTKLTVNNIQAKINRCKFTPSKELTETELKHIELYKPEEYYSKSPRLKRVIEPKTIKLDSSPDVGDKQQLPLILTIGPMITMGISSAVTIMNTLSRVSNGTTTIKDQLPTLIISATMLVSMLVWPLVTRFYNSRMEKKNKQKNLEKYMSYLEEKREELIKEQQLQTEIINENLLTIDECLRIINQRNVNFWDKRTDQSDFLLTRIGIGNQELAVEISYPEEGFTIEENELRKKVEELAEEFKYLKNVPMSYSFYNNAITAIMGTANKTAVFINNIVLQLITFYTYEDLKIVVFTNKANENKWHYIKYLNHNFNDNKTMRFFASNNDIAKEVLDYLNFELSNRIEQNQATKPHYFIIIDDYSKVKQHDFIKKINEQEKNVGFSLVIKENLFKNLPGKCNNFIMISDSGKSGILKDSFENQEKIEFTDEVNYNVDMMGIARILSNIPIEFSKSDGHIPDTITFLEMEAVGKVEQLNILNRWNTNNSTNSLKAEVGVNNQEELIYLDLHEKYHGPHGLIAGTTGSGKSEFIITYILSMCINYSPDDVAFILIDYKGGGLALAFENKSSNMILPHLAGTITNLDKAEMDRTLVSINSETQRRQALFNEARDKLGESTMDIYKYQKHFHDGRLTEPVPHLFIICDEFAELKAQQPDFMDNLISVARIGRSLGVHLILATQKPSGVVNDQIWSNTRFRVCLKVQDESDSKEMLKKPDAAHIKQVGRFYLQVGYDEYYELGQSGWCGAKYYPSNKVVKQIDNSINFINEDGQVIKGIKSSSSTKIEAQGDQLSSVLKNIIEASKRTNKHARKLWLDNIPEIITVADIEKKYNYKPTPYNVVGIIGEYDAPEIQEQGIVTYNLLEDGNSIIYGNDSIEREMFLNAILYSTIKNHTPEEVNFYIADFGSEALKKYESAPHLSGYVTVNESNRISNLFKIISEEKAKRRKKFIDYGGEYSKYIASSDEKMPLLVVIINNFDTMKDNYDGIIYNDMPDATRDSDRYGIIYIITAIGSNSVRSNVQQNFKTFFTYKLKDKFDYQMVFGKKKDIMPRDITGRGIIDNGDLHEFQTVSITDKDDSSYIDSFIKNIKTKYSEYKTYLKLPVLPNKIRLEHVIDKVTNLSSIPVGISMDEVETQYIDLETNIGIIVSSNKMENMTCFVKSLIKLMTNIKDTSVIIIDAQNNLNFNKQEINNYYNDNLEKVIDSITTYIEELTNKNEIRKGVLIINGIDALVKKLDNEEPLNKLATALKKYEKISTILIETNNKFKTYMVSQWIKKITVNGCGIWIGKDANIQTAIMCNVNRAMSENIKNDMGFVIVDSTPTLCRLLDFYSEDI